MDSHYDVIVVGGRCAGAATAMLLARGGLRVLVIEATQRGTDTLSTHALMRGGVCNCTAGVCSIRSSPRVPRPFVRPEFSYGDDDQTVEIRPGDGISALRAPRRTVLDALLLDAARAAGAEILSPARVTRLLTSGGTVCGVEGVTRGSGVSFRATATLTVGADGRGSTVARAVGAEFHRRGTASGAIIYGYFPGLARDQLPLGVSPGSRRGCGADR